MVRYVGTEHPSPSSHFRKRTPSLCNTSPTTSPLISTAYKHIKIPPKLPKLEVLTKSTVFFALCSKSIYKWRPKPTNKKLVHIFSNQHLSFCFFTGYIQWLITKPTVKCSPLRQRTTLVLKLSWYSVDYVVIWPCLTFKSGPSGAQSINHE
jgi:hypothetical protein